MTHTFTMKRPMLRLYAVYLLIWQLNLVRIAPLLVEGSSPTPSSSMVLRLRLADGSMEKIQISEGKEESTTLADVLHPFDVDNNASVKVGNLVAETTSKPLKEFEIRHGTLITVMPKMEKPKPKFAMKKDIKKSIWNPFPDLARDYEQAVMQTRKRRSSQSGMSYKDIAQIQSSLHAVEPQKEGPLKRIYICRISAERFHGSGIVQRKGQKAEISCRVGLLLGTIQKERVDLKPKKARTSLSSTTSDADYCTVAKVQALWEPPSQIPSKDGKLYDAAKGQKMLSEYSRVLVIADHLGLVPIGWIFSYRDDRLKDDSKKVGFDDADDEIQAVNGMDVATGATLQIQNMKRLGRSEGNKFVTLAMDAETGATEAFQLSDVTIQMAHEDMFESLAIPPSKALSKKNNPSVVTVRNPIIVDGQETTKLETVLCLINTAMLSNLGNYAGKTASNSVKKSNGSLTNKAKKAILKALEADNRSLMEELCDFNVLMALDQSLSEQETETLCGLVKKWARGQKKGTNVDSKLKTKLKSILAS